MIAIIGAMEQEVDAIKVYIENQSTQKLADKELIVGTIDGKNIILLQGGIGKVNTAVYTTLLFTNYPEIEYVINVGSAGGMHISQNVGDVVISSEVIHHDVDVTAFDYVLGQVPQMPVSFKADNELLNKAKFALEKGNVNATVGLIVSGDQFIARQEQVEYIKSNFETALCAEMEAATIGQVCHMFNKKFIVTRSLSDVYNKGESSIQFDEYIKKASKDSANMCALLIQQL